MGHKELISRIAHRPTDQHVPNWGPYSIVSTKFEDGKDVVLGPMQLHKVEVILGYSYAVAPEHERDSLMLSHIRGRVTREFLRYIYGDVVDRLQGIRRRLFTLYRFGAGPDTFSDMEKIESEINQLCSELEGR